MRPVHNSLEVFDFVFVFVFYFVRLLVSHSVPPLGRHASIHSFDNLGLLKARHLSTMQPNLLAIG